MFTPTEEQLAITTFARESNDNLLVSALAGAAKTSTLVMIAEALSSTPILTLAFNKKIADEMKARLPDNCEAKTLNSLGNSIWRDVIRVWPKINTKKTSDMLYEIVSNMPAGEAKRRGFDNLAEYGKIIAKAKANGYVPDKYSRAGQPPVKRLLDDSEFIELPDEVLDDWEINMLIDVYCRGLDMAFAGEMDYDDQILMPTVFQAAFPRPQLTLVDEAQDLSPLNHAMLKKLVGTRRLIAVGDSCQAIYGFRGADAKSMKKLEESFNMKKLMLSISFRCPVAIVEHARWRAPHMKYPTWAKPGAVNFLQDWDFSDIPLDAVVVCRNNAPLFTLAIKMLKAGRYAQIVGNDIGKGLLKIMKKFGPANMKREAVLGEIDAWLEKKLGKSRDPGPLRDRAACMRVFAKEGDTLGAAMNFAEHIFAAQSPTLLMTGHKSKGLEFDHVFILDKHLLRDEGQDRNLKYVMITRAKETLTYIDLENLIEEDRNDNRETA